MKFLIPIVLSLTSCALVMGTRYQPSGFTGGYKDVALSDDTYRVRYAGNGYTSRTKVEQHWLRRCAELVLIDGYDYFEIVEAETRTNTKSMQQDEHCSGQVTNNGYSHDVDMTCRGGGTHQTNSYIKEGIIRAHNKKSRPKGKVVYSVRQIMGVYGH